MNSHTNYNCSWRFVTVTTYVVEYHNTHLIYVRVLIVCSSIVSGLPPEAYSIWEAYPWRFGKAFCIIKTLFAEMTSYASVLTITAFTVERYIAICKPLESHKIVAFSRCIKIIIAIWIVSLCCALPYPIHTDLFYYVTDTTGRPITDSLQCNRPPRYSSRMTLLFQMSSCVFFLFPLTVIVVLYSLIGLALKRADLRRETSDKLYNSSRGQGHGGSNRGQGHEVRKSPSYVARRSVLKVLGMFITPRNSSYQHFDIFSFNILIKIT